MNKEQIEDIIKDLEKREYEVRFKTYEDNIVGFYCNEHAFTIDYNSAKPVVGVGIRLGVYSTFNQKDVDWLNSITDRWEIFHILDKYSNQWYSVAEAFEEFKQKNWR